jgi:3-oxoacyl-[acyl-carrier protein] reductase
MVDHLDILVNNAGFGVIKPLVEMDLASFERVFATNVTGAMLMAREAAKHFSERKSGNIVNIGSTAAVRGAANGTAYDRGFMIELTVFATNPKD